MINLQEIKNVVTWLKNWFYDKTEVYTKSETYSKAEVNSSLGNKVNVSQGSGASNKNVVTNSSGDIITENKVSAGTGLSLSSSNQISHSNSVSAQTSAVFKKITYDGQGHITGTANVTGLDLPSHSHSSTEINDNSSDYHHFRSGLPVTPYSVHDALADIDTAIGALKSIKVIEVVTSLPTASEDTMNKLYIVNELTKVNVYYTVTYTESALNPNIRYRWEKLDEDILDELSIDWSDVENNPFVNNTPSDFITSISLVPRGNDSTADAYNGVIRLYYGDEPSS